MYTVSEYTNDKLYYNEVGTNSNNQSVSAWTINKMQPGYYDVNLYAKAIGTDCILTN